jgi:hypothetical protein
VEDRTVTRKLVVVQVEFIDSKVGRKVARVFQPFLKYGTKLLDATMIHWQYDDLHYESYIYPSDLNAKYDEIWDNESLLE